ncbi:MAG TPA: aminotransferase class V-fold PLP-dependent enzyme, partial [candidate division Zixibacteria bacterium]|nr:aminotransferase class V-fold PLP-dependent enzyme [candidate division Zixibacteria bacterium]
MNSAISQNFIAARKLFPLTAKKAGTVYLNSASTGPLCKPVKQALDRYFHLCQYLNKDDDSLAFDDLEKIRRLGARIIGARIDEVGFGWNTGYGLNLAAQGLPLKKGDEILLSDIEFPSNVYPWLALKEKGLKIKFIKSVNRFFDIDNFEKAITKKSRVLSLSMVQFFNGFKNDLKAIGEICRKNRLYFVVDGIQGCGVELIDVKKCNIDIFSSGAQKWLLGQLGSGIFYIRKELQDKLRRP